jgi:hypothetical protein
MCSKSQTPVTTMMEVTRQQQGSGLGSDQSQTIPDGNIAQLHHMRLKPAHLYRHCEYQSFCFWQVQGLWHLVGPV